MARGKRVLVIDDDPDFTASVRALLESEEYEVDVAASGRAGLERVKDAPPDLIVLDVMMESIVEGYVVNQALRFQPDFQPWSGIPIVMVSSIEESPDERFGRAEEVELIRPNRYLTKPLDVPLFLKVVAESIRRDAVTR